MGDKVLVHDPADPAGPLQHGTVAIVDTTRDNNDLGVRISAGGGPSKVTRPLRLTVHLDPRDMEDARFVRFVDDDGTPPIYYATYTAYDGSQVRSQLLATADFGTFSATQVSGLAAQNKGMLTHGVGAMRRYSIGVELLDLEDPTRVIGHLTEPLLSPTEDERDGYVPNVVYSCGAMVHGDSLVIPYGISDANIGIATVSVADLLARLT